MPRVAPSLLLSAALLASLLLACSMMDPEEPSDSTEINENIVLAADCCPEGRYAQFVMGDWTSDRLYATKSPWEFKLNNSLQAAEARELFEFEGDGRPINYLELSEDGTRLLVVRSRYVDASAGSLHEYDLRSEGRPLPSEVPLLRDSTHAVSSAVYLPGSEGEKVVYYSYGPVPELENENGPTPGYYLLDRTTGEDSLLVEHASPAGPEEIVNGFDVSPDAQTLLYPLQHTNFGGVTPPRVVRHNLISGTQDTLDWSFDTQFLWLRYAPEGQQLAYGGYPMQAIGNIVAGSNEIGMIDLQTGAQRILDTSPYPGESMDLFPRWSPDGRHLLYSSAEVNVPGGTIERYSLYILQNVN